MYLTMLGTGNGFIPGQMDSNALLEENGCKTLIDCGTTAWQSLEVLGVPREDIDAIFVTHIHFDHAGGLESIALYSKYVSHKKVKLIVPSPIRRILWDSYLSGGLTNPDCSCLEDYFDVVSPVKGEIFDLCGGIEARWFPTRHIDGKFSCGLLFGGRVAYTSDMVQDLPLVTTLVEQGAEIIFHDCQMRDASVHCSYEAVLTYPQKILDRLCLIHHGQLVPPGGVPRFAVQHRRMDLSKWPFCETGAEEDPLVQKTIAHIQRLQSDEPTGHDWLHTQRVYR